MRVRQERMQKYYFEQTCRAIEAENARAEMAAQEKRIAPAPAVEREEQRDPVEMAKAANAALRGDAV